ncbi:esterase-like activity of phytase family protein [Streptomyces aidingensis]|uniref:Esterase-like activity of phytase n=1 Tax=Streptomyces aidingensis TaxID=910347 RepID=A0A1I1UMF0_9ACTN|nr:esterase-like activity of phytase family protein [Streptomyces aidingensis]SFD69150.1 Esterase-like activity of phytase [Streptomyces aidingensis]
MAVAVAAGLGGWWLAGSGNEDRACSPEVSLVDYSDALDKVGHGGRPVAGLSAMAFTGPGRALILADKTPVVYEVGLGGTGRELAPEITDSTALRDTGGVPLRLYALSLAEAPDVSGVASLYGAPPDVFPHKRLPADIADCPSLGATAREPQPNPLLDTIEGMTPGGAVADGADAGRRLLHLVSDDNAGSHQTTRLYALAVDLPDQTG